MHLFMYAAGFASAVIILFICALGNREARMRRKRKKAKNDTYGEKIPRAAPALRGRKKVKIDTYCKAITSIVIGHGLAMITMSYILSWFAKDTVADVSITLITEVVAPLCLYLGTNCIMNIFEKNELTFSRPIQMQKIQEVWNDAYGGMEEMEDAAE